MEPNIKKAWQFIGATYLISYLLAGLFTLFGGDSKSPGFMFLGLIYMFVPMSVAIFMQKRIEKKPLRELGISFRWNRWFFVAWFLPVLIAIAAFGVSLLFPGVTFSPGMEGMFARFGSNVKPEQLAQMKAMLVHAPIHPFYMAIVQGLLAGITVNAVAGFGEEVGWRGYLLKNLSFLGFWKSSLLIGLVWGFWHAPLILHGLNYPQHHVLGVFMMIAWTMLLAPLFSYIRLKSRSVIAAAILHGSLNGSAGLAVMVVAGGNDLTIGVTGLAGFIVLFVVDLLIFLFDRNPEASVIA
ncbi:MAG TPA: CPBP family intramembrane glutamic endopeptidase [Chroococcales cyanobacterium]|jgi:membrane protease YdiL (CAAX protease family)